MLTEYGQEANARKGLQGSQMRQSGHSEGKTFPSIQETEGGSNAGRGQTSPKHATAVPDRRSFAMLQRHNQAVLKEELRVNSSMSQHDQQVGAALGPSSKAHATDSFMRHLVGSQMSQTKVDQFFSTRSQSQQVRYLTQTNTVDKHGADKGSKHSLPKKAGNRGSQAAAHLAAHRRSQYRKGEMMQYLDLSRPNQYLSRQPNNIQNYYNQKEQLLSRKLHQSQLAPDKAGMMASQDALHQSVVGILRYTASNDSSCRLTAALRREGEQEQPVVIDGSAYGQSARDSGLAHTFRNQNGGTDGNITLQEASRASAVAG
jgi:hypothetical protein